MTKESKKYRITIDVEGGTEVATIRTSDDREWKVEGLAIFADGGDQNLFTFFWNSPVVAARGAVRSCIQAIYQGNKIAETFYKCLLREFIMATGNVTRRQTVTGEEILARWDKEDEEAADEDKKKYH